MAKLTLYELSQQLAVAEDKHEQYKIDADKEKTELDDLQKKLQDEQTSRKELTDGLDKIKSQIASAIDKKTLETARKDALKEEDFESKADYDKAVADATTKIATLDSDIAKNEVSKTAQEDSIKENASNIAETESKIAKLNASPIFKLLDEAREAVTKAQALYDAQKALEEEAISVGTYDLDPALRFRQAQSVKNAARIAIINRAAKEGLEKFATKYVDKGFVVKSSTFSHPLELVAGYSNGIKWNGTNANDISDANTDARATRDKTLKKLTEEDIAAVKIDGRDIFRELVEQYNRETGSVAWTKDEAIELTDIAYVEQDSSYIFGAKQTDLWEKLSRLVTSYYENLSKVRNEYALAVGAVEAHKAFNANVIKAYTAIAADASADELEAAEWEDIEIGFDVVGKQVQASADKAKGELDNTLTLAKAAIDSLKAHTTYDNAYGCAYYDNNMAGATANTSIRHLDFSKLEAMDMITLIPVVRIYESEYSLAGHPLSIGFSGPLTIGGADKILTEFKIHNSINLISSFKQIRLHLTELAEFSATYVAKTQASNLVSERVTAALSTVNENYISDRRKVAESLNFGFVDARVAKALSQVYSSKADEIFKRIQNAIKKGSTFIYCEGRVEATIIADLIAAKYSVSEVFDTMNYDTGKTETAVIDGRGTVAVTDIATIISWDTAIADPKAAAKEGGSFESHAAIKIWNDAATENNLGGGMVKRSIGDTYVKPE